ncbi:hypothetical protein HDU78_000891 [Chytriomyces hyalinus]|nr:hypothetical protein HDU78_000891 [Chytriomyces hyalinus]
MAETTATIAAVAVELKQHIFSYVLLEGRLEPCLQDFLRLRLVCKAWNTAIQTGRPISFRVRIETAQHRCDKAALAPLPISPYAFPLLANCHHSKPRSACALANAKICKSTWAAIETHEQLSDMLERLVASVSGLKIEVTDWIVNASRCLPVKPFIEAYEDSFSDENQQEQEEEEEITSWLTPVVERANRKTLPPLNLYKAVKTSGYINWGEGENDEGPYGYGVFTHLRQLYIAEDDRYFNTSFTACPRLECLRIESGSHMFDFEFPTLLNACTKLKHVSYAEFDYHLPDADNFETPAAYALESIGLSARGYVDPTSIQHFTNLLETNRAYLQSLSALKMVVVDAGDGGGDMGVIPKTQKAVVALLDSFSTISSLQTVLFTNVCKKKHASLVKVSETYSKFQVLLEYPQKNDGLPSSADGNGGDGGDGDDDQDNDDEDNDADEDDGDGDEGDMDEDEDKMDEDEEVDASISLKGRTLVFTGTLSQMTRAVAATKAKQCGATVASSLTKAVDLVVNAGDGGAKLEKAGAQGIEIWDEKKFMRALEIKAAEDAQQSNNEPSREPSSTASSSKSAPKKRTLQGKTVTFTGTLASMSRAEAAQKAVAQGATVASSLTKAVNLVISSKSDGSVLEKARERGIDVWTEIEFLKVVNETASSTAISERKKGKPSANVVVDFVVDVGELKVSKEKQGANRRKPAKPAVESPSLSVSGRNLVFLGTLTLIKRAEATRKAILLGANVVATLTKVVDLVIAGNDADEKLEKARVQGVEVWDEETFMRVTAEDSPPISQKSTDTKDDTVKTSQGPSAKRKAASETPSAPAHASRSKIDIAGRTIIFTGTLLLMNRAEATKQANLLDATVHSSFNKSIDLVVAGRDAGAKLDKARAQGVEIWDEQTFLDVLAGSKERASSLVTKVKKR